MSGFWFLGAGMSLFFAWIVGYMQRGDARVRTERVAGLRVRDIRDLNAGEICAIQARVSESQGSFPSPLHGVPVVHSEVRVAVHEKSPSGASHLAPLHHERRGERFLVSDESGAIEVNFEGEEGFFVEARVRESGPVLGDETLAYLRAQGLPLYPAGSREARDDEESPGRPVDPNALRPFVVRSQELRPGDELLVLGVVAAAEEGSLEITSGPRFAVELREGTLDAYQAAALSAHRKMLRATQFFLGLAAGFALLGGLSLMGVLG